GAIKVLDKLQQSNILSSKALTTVVNLSSKAFGGLGKAIVATGIGALVVGLGILIANFDKVKEKLDFLIPAFEKLQSIISGIGNVISSAFKGNFDIIDNFKAGVIEKMKEIEEEKEKIGAASQEKELNNTIKHNEAKLGSDYKYSKEGQKLYKEYFESRLKQYKKDSEEYKAIEIEKIAFDRELLEKEKEITNKANEEYKKRLEERRKAIEEYNKALESFEKSGQSMYLSNLEKSITKEKELANTKEEVNSAFAKEMVLMDLKQKQEKESVFKQYDDLIAKAKKNKQDTTEIEKEKNFQLSQINIKYSGEIEKITNDKNKNILGLEQKANDKLKLQSIQTTQTIVKERKKSYRDLQDWAEKQIEAVSKVFDEAFAVMNPAADLLGSIFDVQMEEANTKLEEANSRYDEAVNKSKETTDRIKKLEEEAKSASGGRLVVLEEQIAREMQVKKEAEKQEKELQKEKEKREKEAAKIEKKQKKLQLSQDLVGGLADSYIGVLSALKYGPILGPILAAMLAALAVVKAATVSAQIAKLEDGGLIKGKSHAEGGIPILGTNIEVEGSEFVINKKSTQKNLPLIDYINSNRRELTINDLETFYSKKNKSISQPFKNKFENGGVIDFSNFSNTDDDTSKILSAISSINLQPVVSVSEINRVSGNIVRVKELAGADI
ncbi:hypothetical protein EZS27_008660, partial [termite gut metagenome]